MKFEDLQKAWQAQPAHAAAAINPELLLREVRRNQRNFQAIIFWRDVREVGVSALLAVYFGWHGWRHDRWADELLALVCFGIGAFMLVDRWRQRGQRPVANDPLKASAIHSLHQVTHQIWLLKNVLWWYLLPLGVALVIDILLPLAPTWRTKNAALQDIGFVVIFISLVFGFVYWINQYAVRKQLEPRRQELAELLASLAGSPPPEAKP